MDSTILLVSTVSHAQGARGAASALACAASTPEQAALLVDVGARQPRPTLISSPAAAAIETAIAGLFPDCSPAARGLLCQLALAPDRDRLVGLALVASIRLELSSLVVHLPYELLLAVLHQGVVRPGGVLLRADMESDPDAAEQTVRHLTPPEVPVAILDHRLNWVAERRALFGVLPTDAPGGLPGKVVDRLLPGLNG